MSLRFLPYLNTGDTTTWDRWKWVEKRLPITRNGETLIDVGCGSGAFTIGAALRGYTALGLSWDQQNQDKATHRARVCGVSVDETPVASSASERGSARFEVLDVRQLGERADLRGRFDVALCCECAEHIIDDRKLLREIADSLKAGGRLLFTVPNFHYRAMSERDMGPFCAEETGWHVRRGYSPAMLRELCEESGLVCEEVSYCTGFISQKITALMRSLGRFGTRFAWAAAFPLRPLTIFDGLLSRIFHYPGYSICMVAVKPRFRG